MGVSFVPKWRMTETLRKIKAVISGFSRYLYTYVCIFLSYEKMVISCRNSNHNGVDRLPCQFRYSEERPSTSIFTRIDVLKYNSNMYLDIFYSSSPVSCAALCLCLNIWAFIYSYDTRQCYLHEFKDTICSRSEVLLKNSSKLMITAVSRLFFSENHWIYFMSVVVISSNFCQNPWYWFAWQFVFV